MSERIDIGALEAQFSLTREQVLGASDPREAVKRLIANGATWDTDALPDVSPFEEGLKDTLVAAQVKTSAYNRFDYAQLLDSGLEFLARAVSLRDDGKELSLRAVNDLLDKWKTGREIDLARLNVQNIQGEANGQRAFALALNAIIADLMPRIKTKAKNLDEARFMKEYQELLARKANADYAADLLDERSRTAELSLEMTQTLQKTLRRRYEEPGHALNYKDRIGAWEIEMPPLSHAETAVSVPNDVWVELVVVGMRRPGQN